MAFLNKITILFWKITIITYVIAYPDKFEFQDTDTNMKFNLLDILNDYTKNEKEHRRDSVNDPYENWTGRWLPHRLGEPTPPPKIFPSHKDQSHDSRVAMGVKSVDCDDGKTNLTLDWDHSSTSYTCYGQKIVPDTEIIPQIYCDIIPKNYLALHKCMYETIEYDDDIPTYGFHRPIWPVYGEYKYVPKQRWIHSLEHGAVIMLYHPCANNLEVERLRKIVTSCLRRHIITPYNLLDEEKPLALVTWGCRLMMSYVNTALVTKFIQEHALHAPEQVSTDGGFDDQLIKKANIVFDEEDSVVCSKVI